MLAAGLAGGETFVCVAAGTIGGFGFACAFTTGFFATHFFLAVNFPGLREEVFCVETGFDAGLFFTGKGPTVFPCSGTCVISAAGFTPAATAVLVVATVSGTGFAIPRRSGFTTICRS